MTLLRRTVRKPAGFGLLTIEESVVEEHDTLMCVHCQFIWKVQPGSGRVRGWCMRCSGPTCGKKPCESRCVPFERAIEEQERRIRLRQAVSRNFGV